DGRAVVVRRLLEPARGHQEVGVVVLGLRQAGLDRNGRAIVLGSLLGFAEPRVELDEVDVRAHAPRVLAERTLVLLDGGPELSLLRELDALSEAGVGARLELEYAREQGIGNRRPGELVLLIERELLLRLLCFAEVAVRAREREVGGAEGGE